MSIKGYKVFNPDWTCRGFQYMGYLATLLSSWWVVSHTAHRIMGINLVVEYGTLTPAA